MDFKNNNNKEIKRSLSFPEWAIKNQNEISANLQALGLQFINEQGENLRMPVMGLTLDNRWYYIDKPTKKQSYRGSMEIDAYGVPYLHLTYHTFRHGGFSARFDSKAATKSLWQNDKKHIAPIIKPVINKPIISPTIPVINYLERDLAHWNSLTLHGESHYLNRKGLGDADIVGIRYAKNHIAISIINTSGEFQGIQRIFNDNQKRFTKGLNKKGNFALIGANSLPVKISTIHICEGAATGATINLAIGESVFVALDAFNLLPVGRALKQLYPKTTIVYWSDNDWQKANKLNPQGRVIGNTGLIQANFAAFKLRNALVVTPDFLALTEELINSVNYITLDNIIKHTQITSMLFLQSFLISLLTTAVNAIKSATDFNDLFKLSGVGEIVKSQLKKPDIALALTHKLSSYHRYTHGVISPSQFKLGSKITYTKKYLPSDVFKSDGVHLVRSAIGTGKTETVAELLRANNQASVLFTTHLISLVESAADRLGLVSYNDCDTFDLQIEPRLAVCLNSLAKLTAEGSLRNYDIVIIDEVEQVLSRLTTHIAQKPLVFAVLQHLISHAKQVICLDAHLSNITVEFIQALCDTKPITVHFNTFAPGSERVIVMHESVESVQVAAMQYLYDAKNVYLAFNSKKEAFKIYSALKEIFPAKKGLYISGDNNGDKDNIAFFNDVNTVSKNYDYIVCTPSVSTGVSIDNKHFDFVGGVFNAQINTANDCMQALGRVRDISTLHVYCEQRLGHEPLNSQIIQARWTATHQHDMALMNLDSDGSRVILNPLYEQLITSVTQSRNRSYNDFYLQFCLLSLADGLTLIYSDAIVDGELRRQVRDLKVAVVQEDIRIHNQEALTLSANELLNLANKPRKTLAEYRQYKKQQVIEFYNLHTTDTESIAALSALDDDGRFKQQVLNLELALGDEKVAKARFLKQLESDEQFAADLTYYVSLQRLYKQLLKCLHADTSFNQISTGDYRYTRETILDSGFIAWIEKERGVLQGVVSIPSTSQLERDPIRFISTLLGKLGLKQRRVGRASMAEYHLDIRRTELLNSLVLRRSEGLAGVTIPLDTSNCPVKRTLPLEIFGECLRKLKDFFSFESQVPIFT